MGTAMATVMPRAKIVFQLGLRNRLLLCRESWRGDYSIRLTRPLRGRAGCCGSVYSVRFGYARRELSFSPLALIEIIQLFRSWWQFVL